MKLATLDNGTRDGMLVVVSKDLTRCSAAGGAAPGIPNRRVTHGGEQPRQGVDPGRDQHPQRSLPRQPIGEGDNQPAEQPTQHAAD